MQREINKLNKRSNKNYMKINTKKLKKYLLVISKISLHRILN